MDNRFRVEVISQTPNPQQTIYAAMHQDYSEGFVFDEREQWPSEERAGAIAVKRLLGGGRGHFGSIENPQIVLNCGWFPHSTMQQVRTHRHLSFDVQCLAGDTEVTFVDKHGQTSQKLKKTIGDLYDLWHNGEAAVRTRHIKGRNGEAPGEYRRDCKTRLRKMRVRSLNEASNTFTTNYIEDVVFNGINPVYKVTLEDGKTLECTQNHKIYTPYGWRVLAQLSVGSKVMVNGQPLKDADKTYQNKEWLRFHFLNGLTPKGVAAIAGCSTESVKKWAYKHELTWDKKPWNKGLKYSINLSQIERDRRSNHAKSVTEHRVKNGLILSGIDHPSWKNLAPEKRAYNWLKYNRAEILKLKGAECNHCHQTENLHCHHIQPVKERPDLAFDFDNFEVLCASCHISHHKSGKQNPLCAHQKAIVSIEYVGAQPTYDLVMKSPHHNFVAAGVVVHNSGRYTGKRIIDVSKGFREVDEVFYLRPAGDYRDREGKRYSYSEAQRYSDLEYCLESAHRYRKRVIDDGFSEEHARGLIPFDVRQHWVMSANARSLMHLLDLRWKADAQLECQQLCELIWPHFKAWVPAIAEWYEDSRAKKARLAP